MKKLIVAIAMLVCVRPVFVEQASPTGAAPSFSPVTWERLLNAADEPKNWLMYSATLDSRRFSGLDQIDRQNVGGLELVWAHQIPLLERAETTPLVVDGVMFITESPSTTWSRSMPRLGVRTGATIIRCRMICGCVAAATTEASQFSARRFT